MKTKFLIRSDFKAIRKGEFVTANTKAGEFVYETGNGGDLSMAQIMEIATANKLNVPKSGKKSDVVLKLDEQLKTLKLDEVNKMTDTAIVEQICEAGVAAGKTDDEMLIEIVSKGVKFSVAGKLFRQVMESKGYRTSAKDRITKADELLKDVSLETQSDLESAIELITTNVPDTNEKQAMAVLRKFAKAKEIELPKIEKAVKVAKGGFRNQAYSWMINNPRAAEADLTKWVMESKGKKEDVAKRMCDVFRNMKAFAKKLGAEV